MKALTLYQPYAQLIAAGAKRIETRSWKTEYRGPLAIHAGQCRDYLHLLGDFRFNDALGDITEPPLGAVVAVGELVGCVPVEALTRSLFRKTYGDIFTAQEREFGNYGRGRYGWVLQNVRPLPEPIRARGAQQLWDWKEPQEVWSWLSK